MKTDTFPFGLAACTFLLAALAGCRSSDFYQSRSFARPFATAPVIIADDYDYYPRYEIYYSRHRNEYVGREGGWIRRSDPDCVTYRMLSDGPSVPMDFHDSPELHHNEVVQRYPRNWEPSPRDREHANEDRRKDREGHYQDEGKARG